MSGAADRGEEVVKGLVGACGFAGCVEVHEEAADDGEYEGGQLGSAEAAQAVLEGWEPVRGGGASKARPERFSAGVVQPAEHAQVGLALRPGHRGPGSLERHWVGLVGSDAQEIGERL